MRCKVMRGGVSMYMCVCVCVHARLCVYCYGIHRVHVCQARASDRDTETLNPEPCILNPKAQAVS
jgi:hypothetical protein